MSKIEMECPVCRKRFEINAYDYRVKHGKKLYCSRECSFKGLMTGEVKECPVCGKEFYTTRNKTCSVGCGRRLKKMNFNHKTYMENGYIVEYQNGYNKKGNVKQHRRIMEEHLGRPLRDNEIVHHKNGDKTDNRIENLEVMERGKHSSMHRKEEKANGKHLFGGYHNN